MLAPYIYCQVHIHLTQRTSCWCWHLTFTARYIYTWHRGQHAGTGPWHLLPDTYTLGTGDNMLMLAPDIYCQVHIHLTQGKTRWCWPLISNAMYIYTWHRGHHADAGIWYLLPGTYTLDTEDNTLEQAPDIYWQIHTHLALVDLVCLQTDDFRLFPRKQADKRQTSVCFLKTENGSFLPWPANNKW